MSDLISRQAALDLKTLAPIAPVMNGEDVHYEEVVFVRDLEKLSSVESEISPYIAEIEAEYKKWINIPYIRKPLAKALYEVWKKHDREDTERR